MRGGSGPFLSKAQSCSPFVTNRGQSLSIKVGKWQLEPVFSEDRAPMSRCQAILYRVDFAKVFFSLNQMYKCLKPPQLSWEGVCDLLFDQAVVLSSQH